MTPTLLGHYAPGTDEWWEARRNRLGGSEIAAVLGLSPFESRFSLWHRKMGYAARAQQKPEMEWGNRLEPAVGAKFFETDGRYQAIHNGTYAHSDRPWQCASPDAQVADANGVVNSILEVKTSPMGEGWGEPGTDQIPVYYRCQALWYLDILGLPLAHVAVLISGYDYREYRIELDDQARADIDVMRTAGAEFIASLTDGARPDIDDHDQTYQVIREQHPDIEAGEEVEVEPGLAEEYCDSQAAYTAAEKRHKVARAQLLDAMGDANYAVWNGTRIARRQANVGAVPHLVTMRRQPKATITDKASA